MPIKKAESEPIKRIVSPDGKEAETRYEVLDTKGTLSLVKLTPITGRTHQLRVHMSYIGSPIYGDSMYGAPQDNERTHLHCKKLVFNHPMSKEKIFLKAPVPLSFKKLDFDIE